MRSYERVDLPGGRTYAILGGYDCNANPCGRNGCGTRPGAGHGIGCAIWTFVVGLGSECALSLEVFSGIYPWTQRHRNFPHGGSFDLHVGANEDPTDTGTACEFVKGRRCYGQHTANLAAREFYEKHSAGPVERSNSDRVSDSELLAVVAPHEQPVSFWFALEAERLAWMKRYWPAATMLEEPFGRCFKCGAFAEAASGSPCSLSGSNGMHMWGAP